MSVAIWKYESLRSVFTDLIRVIALTENSNRVLSSPASLENSVTQMVLGEISSVMPLLSLLPTSSNNSSELYNYTQLMLGLCTTISHTVDSPEIRAACFQILVSSLDSESPPLIVLPNIVDIALSDSEERQKEVNRILTGLLMNYELKNVKLLLRSDLQYDLVIQEVPQSMTRLVKGVKDPKLRRYLQNQFLNSCSQLSKAILSDAYSLSEEMIIRDHISELRVLQWRISESIISVLSTIEQKWNPYKPQEEVDLSLMKSYLDVWFHLVTVSIVVASHL